MVDLFAPPTSEELIQRKIEIVGILLNRFQEQLDYAATLDPKTFSLEKAQWITKDLEEMTDRIKSLKEKLYSKENK
jgi:hypothetical protein